MPPALPDPQRETGVSGPPHIQSFPSARSSRGSRPTPKLNQSTKAPIWWSNAIFFLSVHLFAILGAFFISPIHKVSRINLLLCWIYCQLGTFGITLGYHRMWSHRAYTAIEPFRWFLAFAASFGFQGSARWWVLRHRLHHRWTDSEHDPYNAKKGLIFSHVGWIFRNPKYEKLKLVDRTDLDRDPVVSFQHKHYLPISLFIGFGLPHILSTYVFKCNTHSAWDGLIWGGLVSRLVIWHLTFFINSLAHYVGDQLFDLDITARGNFWLALLTCGEANHNYHHVFPQDYRNGPAPFDWDPTKWIIYLLYTYTPLITHIHFASPAEIDYARNKVLKLTSPASASSGHKAGASSWFLSFEDLFRQRLSLDNKEGDQDMSSGEPEWTDHSSEAISPDPLVPATRKSYPNIDLTILPSSASQSDAEGYQTLMPSPCSARQSIENIKAHHSSDPIMFRNRKQPLPIWSRSTIHQHLWNYLLSGDHEPMASNEAKLEIVRRQCKNLIILLIDNHLLDLKSYALGGSHPGGIKILRQYSIIRPSSSSLDRSLTETSSKVPDNAEAGRNPSAIEKLSTTNDAATAGEETDDWLNGYQIEWIDSTDAFYFDLNQHSSPAKWKMKQLRIARLTTQ